MTLETIVSTAFGLGLFVNAFLFVPQIIKLWRTKDSTEVSFLTFAGFNVLQLLMIWHGYLHNDYALITGGTASLITCGMVTVLICVYRRKKN